MLFFLRGGWGNNTCVIDEDDAGHRVDTDSRDVGGGGCVLVDGGILAGLCKLLTLETADAPAVTESINSRCFFFHSEPRLSVDTDWAWRVEFQQFLRLDLILFFIISVSYVEIHFCG